MPTSYNVPREHNNGVVTRGLGTAHTPSVAPAMQREGVLLVLAVAAFALQGVAAQEPKTDCGDCDRSKCPLISECPGAEAMDSCGCCSVCRRSLGQRCDPGPSRTVIYGPCDEYLVCTPRPDLPSRDEATCQCIQQKEVCGSDNVTYPTLCHLLAQTKQMPDLTVQQQAPCLVKPIIKTAPTSSKRHLGGILVLDCEAVGYPVPSITWELYRPNGVSIKLPNDDSGIAVQVRGGPEHHMVTGWVQVMKVTKENVGIYVCNAENSQGSVKAAATITYFEKGQQRQNEL